MFKKTPGFLGFLLCWLNTTQHNFAAGLENPGQLGCLGSTQQAFASQEARAFESPVDGRKRCVFQYIPALQKKNRCLTAALLAPSPLPPLLCQPLPPPTEKPSAILWLGLPNPARFCGWVFQPSRAGQSRKENPGPFGGLGFQPTGGVGFF